MLKARGRLSVERTLQIGIELADALTRAHYLKIIHRDIKPANVLMTEDGVPKLTDFGVAHIGGAGSMTGAGLAVGTPDYMSPEAVNGDEVDDRADIWSLGVLLFELLTGRHPFRAEAVTGTLVNILTQSPPDLDTLRPETPIALIDLIGRMLQKDVTNRISSVRLVGAELEAIMRGSQTRRTTMTTPIAIPAFDETRFDTPTPPTAAPKHNLPAQTTPFFGREDEQADIAQLMGRADTRLITVLGQGGMGKTRLALQVGESFVHVFEHGVFFVPLAPLTSPDGIAAAVADAIGYTLQADGRDPLAQISDYLHDKRLLLILDNFEQVLAGAEQVSALLTAAPRLKMIVTSRERLNLTGETVVALGGLDLPTLDDLPNALSFSAVQLFVQSAKRASPSFELADNDLRQVIRIVQSVDGMPLGVVLAASWTDSLSVVEIADEIARSLDFLESELRDLPARHRSMRAVFDYSWALLNEAEREAFVKLAVFRGGFTREAAQASCGASLRILTTLQNKSLVRRHPDSGRYELHELVRQYAEGRLADLPAQHASAQAAHAEYYTDFLVKRANVYMNDGEELRTLGEIEAEQDNIRSAWEYAILANRLDLVDKSIDVVAMFFEAKGWAKEAVMVFHEVAQAIGCVPGVSDLLVARAKLYAAQMEVLLGDFDPAAQHALKALEVFERHGYKMGIAKVYGNLAYISMNRGNYAEATEQLEKSIQAALTSGHRFGEWYAKRTEASLAYVLFLQGEYSKSEAMYRRLIDDSAKLKTRYGAIYLYNNLGEVLHAQSRDDEARPLFQKAYDLFSEVKNLRWKAVVLVNLGLVEHSASRFGEAEAYFRRALPLYREVGDRRGEAEALNRLGSTVYWYGRYREAIEYHQQAYTLFERVGNPKGAADALVLCSIAQNAVGHYDESKRGLDRAFEIRGRLGNLSDIVDVQQILSINALYRDDYEEALRYLEQANDILLSSSEPDPINTMRHTTLRGIILAEAGRFDEAIPELESAWEGLERHAIYWALAQAGAALGLAYIQTGRIEKALTVGRRAVEAGAIAKATGWTLLAITSAAMAIGLRGNPLNGVEYISYVLHAPLTEQYVREHADIVLESLREQLAKPEYDAAWERGKHLTHGEVVSAILGRPVEV
jgi:predicted ATPase/Flp pilus assembly protein TadD